MVLFGIKTEHSHFAAWSVYILLCFACSPVVAFEEAIPEPNSLVWVDRALILDPEGRVLDIQDVDELTPAGGPTGQRHGGEIHFFSEKQKSLECHWRYGARQGTLKQWHPNGKLKLEIPFERGVVDGLVRTYFSSGMMSEESQYANGKKQGLTLTFYLNGNFRSRSIYIDGLMTNLSEMFEPISVAYAPRLEYVR